MFGMYIYCPTTTDHFSGFLLFAKIRVNFIRTNGIFICMFDRFCGSLLFIVHLITFCIFYCDKENLFDINSNFTTTTYFIVMASYELLDLHFCLNDPKYKNDILMNQHHIGAIFSSLIILSVGESDLFNNEITSFYAVYCSLLGSSNILMNFRYFVILLCSNKMINLVNYLFAGYFLVVRVVVGNIFGVI